MKKLSIIGLIFISNLFFIISCKSHMPATDNTAVANNTQSDNPGTGIPNTAVAENMAVAPEENMNQKDTVPAARSKDYRYRFIVSFISIGEGSDENAFIKFQSYLNDWKTTRKKAIQYDKFQWGREGEADYCFPLTELDAAQQKQFITETRNMFKENNLIQFAENERCSHRR